MQWTPGGVSNDVEDRRGETGGGGGGFNVGGLGPVHLGLGGTIVLLVLSFFFRTNLFNVFTGGGGGPESAPTAETRNAPPASQSAGEQREVQFVSFVLDDVQKNWDAILPREGGRSYRHSKLVLFRDATDSGCGTAQEATGPFYCPADQKVYLDLGFFNELQSKFGAPGEFAQAYVIAHEVGHHVQDILGIERKVRQAMQENPSERNAMSVRLELQADCFAGVWANSTEQRKLVNEADIRAGLQAAAAVGDDRLQRMAGRRVSPESWTHGSSAQRTEWFTKGLQAGNIAACNTFQGL